MKAIFKSVLLLATLSLPVHLVHASPTTGQSKKDKNADVQKNAAVTREYCDKLKFDFAKYMACLKLVEAPLAPPEKVQTVDAGTAAGSMGDNGAD